MRGRRARDRAAIGRRYRDPAAKFEARLRHYAEAKLVHASKLQTAIVVPHDDIGLEDAQTGAGPLALVDRSIAVERPPTDVPGLGRHGFPSLG